MARAVHVSPPRGRFVRHAVEMVAAMLVGMSILNGVAAGVLAMTGTSTRELIDEAPAVAALGMAFNMALPMALWMRYRGHSRARSAEMGIVMFMPGLLAVVLLATTTFESTAICGFECSLMIPLMLGLMWLRRDEY